MITPDAFLKQSRRLLTSTSEEDFRSAISRSYYSLFHETTMILEKKHRPKVLTEIKQDLAKRGITRYDKMRVGLFDKSYLNSLHVNYHGILCKVLNGLDWSLAQSFDESRVDRNNAD